MVLPRTAPKPFRPLAETVNARRCQLQDSDAELREDHLCSCQRALDSLSSLPSQYLTPAIASLLAHQFSISRLKVSHLRNTPLMGGLHHQLFLLPVKEKLQKELTIFPHLHIFPAILSQTHSGWAFGLISPQNLLLSRSTVTSTLQNSKVSAHFSSFLTCRQYWTQPIPAPSLLHFCPRGFQGTIFLDPPLPLPMAFLVSLVIPHHLLISKH